LKLYDPSAQTINASDPNDFCHVKFPVELILCKEFMIFAESIRLNHCGFLTSDFFNDFIAIFPLPKQVINGSIQPKSFPSL